MPKYAAFLRGIGPSNPNMHQAKLVGVLEDLGFSNVQAVISSGNVIFESESKDVKSLEAKIERSWPSKLGFNSTTIIRSQKQLQALVKANPYRDTEHSRRNYLLVTFFKNPPSPPQSDNYVTKLGVNALCSIIDTTSSKTPDFMTKTEKQFGKEITSRTWKTIQRIIKKMEP